MSTSEEAGDWVLHSPRAWLGTAFHRLMAAKPSDESAAERLWERAIGELLTTASGHRLDQRYSRPEHWPGYYLVRQRAIASALRDSPALRTSARPAKAVLSAIGNEKLLIARNGLLAGRPDHFDLQSVTEYKSALPDSAWPEAASLVDGYWRQLRLYAVLVGESVGWPEVARIVAASGEVLEQKIDRGSCEAEADAAIAGLQAMNQSLSRGRGSSELASPGEIACTQCPYQAICPAFWSWCASANWPQLREPAARGTVEAVDTGIDGDLYTVSLKLDGRHGEGGPLSLALRRAIHGDLTGCGQKARVRIVHARVRPDGRLRADISTCVFCEEELPDLKCKGSA